MPSITIPDSASTELVPANYNRIAIAISNSHATSNLHIAFAETATINHAYIPPGGNMTFSEYKLKHAINAISSSGNITAKYSEVTG